MFNILQQLFKYILLLSNVTNTKDNLQTSGALVHVMKPQTLVKVFGISSFRYFCKTKVKWKRLLENHTLLTLAFTVFVFSTSTYDEIANEYHIINLKRNV